MKSNLAQIQPENPEPLTRSPRPLDSAVIKDLKNLSGILPQPFVCLTFDDGPDPVYTPLILDLLAEQKIHATFFVVGESVQRYPQLLERVVAEGHAVGNHTFHHRHPWAISSQRARDEISQTTAIIRAITGEAPRWFRPPHGRLRKAMLEQSHAEQMRTVLWSRSIIDWGPLGTDTGIARRLQEVEAGDIVLMHDGQRQHNRPQLVAQQLPEAIQALTKRGIVPVTLDQVASYFFSGI
jgi:peptidoglycan/xylan/chitin deacetylase (PgdA/CDA1 family)